MCALKAEPKNVLFFLIKEIIVIYFLIIDAVDDIDY